MPTRNRHALLPAAIAQFRAQDVADAELVVVSEDGVPPEVVELMRADPRIRHVPCPPGLRLGAKRNLACAAARGELLAHWDDDDWQAPDRLRRQLAALDAEPRAELCGTSRVFFREVDGAGAWEYRYQGPRRPWVYGATLMFRRAYWARQRFPEQDIGEDNAFVWAARPEQVIDLDEPALCVASVHAGNSSRKDTRNAWWTPVPRERLEALVARTRAAIDAMAAGTGAATIDGAGRTAGAPGVVAPEAAAPAPRALLALAGGLGDVLRWAALAPVLAAAGYRVDLLVAADWPDCAALFEGAPGIDRVFAAPRALLKDGAIPLPPGLPVPALAVFSYWAQTLASRLPAARRWLPARGRWLRDGDPGCCADIARELGWTAPLPLPPLAPGLRAAPGEVDAGALAIHAGCKPDWHWKRWHGHAAVAEGYARVLRLGTAADDDAGAAYFAPDPPRWPAHVTDLTAPRPLVETTRRLARCGALLANDSGLMHLGAALGVPTLGVFGITSPAREAMPWPAMHAISAGLPCEPDCRAGAWGRRDCGHHLACLRELTPATVAARLARIAPGLARSGNGGPAPAPAPAPTLARPAPSQMAPREAAPARQGEVAPEPVALAVRLGGGLGDLLFCARVAEAIRALAGFGPVTTYNDRPELARLAFGGRGLLADARPLADWPRAAGLRVELDQFARFADDAARWRASHPALAALIARSAERIAGVRGLVARHPQLDGYWARFNLAAGRDRATALAWTAGFDPAPASGDDASAGAACPADLRADSRADLGADLRTDTVPTGMPTGAGAATARAILAAPLALALDERRAGPRQRLAADGRPWITLHDGFDAGTGLRPGEAVKCWPLGHWEDLVRRLRAARPDLRLVQIGGPTARRIAGVDDCLLGHADLAEALQVLAGAQLHIDGESGLVHAASALGTPAVVLFGPTDRAFFGHAGNLNLDAGVCAPCWWSTPDWLGRCPRGLATPACMQALAPAAVAEAVLARLAEPTPRATAPPLTRAADAAGTRPDAVVRADSHRAADRDGPLVAPRLLRAEAWNAARPLDASAAIARAFGLVTDADGHARHPVTGCHIHATKHWEYAFALDAIDAFARADAHGDDGRGARPATPRAPTGPARAAPPPLRIADLGGGRGALGPWLAHAGHRVTGFDRDHGWEADAATARRFLGWAAGLGLVPRAAALPALPAPDASFDVALLLSVLQHLADPAAALREALRLLRPGGLLLLSFDLSDAPARHEDARMRLTIPSPRRLADWLGLDAALPGFDPAALARSAAELRAAGITGLPDGLTVGALALRKAGADAARAATAEGAGVEGVIEGSVADTAPARVPGTSAHDDAPGGRAPRRVARG
ncbi:glycosyltransferase family 9 protein [Derxia lacustris]|nr:glycosyltransferase family 9 protein [Derxia lacustris]